MEIRTAMDLGAAVREARVQRHLTQTELAELAGVSREWLVRLEHGHPRLELQLVLNAVTAVGLSLLTDDETPALEDETEAAWDEVFTDLAEDTRSTDRGASEDG